MTGTTAAPGSLTYRVASASDVPALSVLWAEHAGWGELTLEKWKEWYVDAPYGGAVVTVAVDAHGGIVGQLAGMPTRVLVDGTEVRAIRMSAPILSRDLRGGLLDMMHPVVGLYYATVQSGMRDGARLVHTNPDRRWTGFFRWLARQDPVRAGFATAELACQSRTVADHVPLPVVDDSFTVTSVTAFDARFDALWDEVARGAFATGCAIVRRMEWLAYKASGSFAITAACDAGGQRLIGFSCVRLSDGLLTDVIVTHGSLYAPVLAATLRRLREIDTDGHSPPSELRVMETPALSPALQALGFAPVDYRFAFACASLPGGPSADAVAPERWHLQAGD